MNDILFSPLSLSQLEVLIEKSVSRAIDKAAKDAGPKSSVNPENDLLTVPEVCEMLTLSIPTIYAMTSTNRIPFMKRGKKVYFSRIEIEAWIKSGRRKTVDEIAAEVNAAPGVSKPAPRPRPLIQAPRPKVFVENPDESTPSRSITNLFGIKDNK